MSKIVYLIEQPLDERNFDRFGVETWIRRGWQVEIWDLTPLAHPRVWQDFVGMGRSLKNFEGYFPIVVRSQLKDRYSAFERNGYYIDITGDNAESIRVKLRLRLLGATRITSEIGTAPEPSEDRNAGLKYKLRKLLARGHGATDIAARLSGSIARKLIAPIVKPGLVVISGEKSIHHGDGTNTIKAHNLDYDIYLKLARSPDESKNYAVFIDQDYCFHSDFIFQGTPFYVTPDRYFPAVRGFLDNMARTLGVEVRIAAHPRASYYRRNPEYFGDVRVEYGRTAELISKCRLVVCHNSTAIQFAVLFGKPVVFLTTDELESSLAGKLIAAFAEELGKPVINADRDLGSVNWQEQLSVNSAKYAAYRKNYIKCEGSLELSHWDIIIDEIEKKVDSGAGAHRVTGTDSQHARNSTLDGLRAVAALSVAALHTLHFIKTPFGDTGNFGVLLFFLLSGYCIALTFGTFGRCPVRAFLIRRAFRLYPAYWIAVLSAAAVASTPISVGQVLANLTMVQTALRFPDINGVFWTLFLELCFYAGVSVLLAIRFENRLSIHVGLLMVLAIGTLIGAIVRRTTGLHLPFSHPMLFSVFALGQLVCIFHRHGKSVSWVRATAAAYLGIVFVGAHVAYGAGGFLEGFTAAQYFGNFALAVAAFVVCVEKGWLGWQWIAYLGRISYCIYLFHVPVYHGLVLRYLPEGIAAGVLALVATIVVSAVIHEIIEKPFIEMGRRLSKKDFSMPVADAAR